MKKYLALFLAGSMLLSFAACASKNYTASSAAPTSPTYNAGAVSSEAAGAQREQQGTVFNTEEYSAIEENRFLSAATSPLSTFAADVDTASYANVRRYLRDGQTPPADAVRIEEMINYFHYDYPEPAMGEPFSVSTEIVPCPWNPDTWLLAVGLKAPSVDMREIPGQNLVFLIDVSGSMDEQNKLPLVKRAFSLLCEQLREEDRVSIVTYASADKVVLSGVSGEKKDKIMSAIENLTAGGSTAGAKGIQSAYELAAKYYTDTGNNRIILATDGDLNVGVTSEGDLKRLVEKERKKGVFLSVMGFGEGNIKDNKMETLADHGNGNYSYIDSISEARKVLVNEMGGTLLTVAKDVKFQVEFNPSVIKGYRLIGYENRLMNAEDFADDTKDGGEIGAGHTVTALYELATIDSAQEIPGVELKYQQAKPAGSAQEWLTVSIRYKKPNEETSSLLSYTVGEGSVRQEMSRNTQLAAAVAQTGMLLRESSYCKNASYASTLQLLQTLDAVEQDPYADELRYFVRQLQD